MFEYDDDTVQSDEGADVLSRLKRASIIEKCAPELLQYEQTLVSEAVSLLRRFEDASAEMQRNFSDAPAAKQEGIRLSVHIQEASQERLRYLLALYHRARLEKIEGLSAAIAAEGADGDTASRLSKSELQFAMGLAGLTASHVAKSFLDKLPEDDAGRLRAMPEPKGVEKGMDRFVFALMLETVGAFQLPLQDGAANGETLTVDLNKDDIVVLRYRVIREFLLQQKAILI